jgi:hypothetical protein
LVVLLELATCEAADAADAGATEAVLAAPSAAAAASPGPHMQRLEQVIDEVQTLIYLADCHNHLPMFESVVVNLETGAQGQVATAAHRLRMARRMELTPWQVRVNNTQSKL